MVKATSPWKELGCSDRLRTQVTSLHILLPNLHSPEWARRALQQVPGSSWLHAGPGSQLTSIPLVPGLGTCRVWAGSSDRSSSGSVHTPHLGFPAPPRLNPPGTSWDALPNPVAAQGKSGGALCRGQQQPLISLRRLQSQQHRGTHTHTGGLGVSTLIPELGKGTIENQALF